MNAARDLLINTAKQYKGRLYYRDFGSLVEARAGVRGPGYMSWMQETLEKLAEDCVQRGEPILSTLCVNADGTVVPGYKLVLEKFARGNADIEVLAARERLRCYRHYQAAGLPPDGGSPVFAEDLVAPRYWASTYPDVTTALASSREVDPGSKLTAALAAVLIGQLEDSADARWSVIRRLVQQADHYQGSIYQLVAEEPETTGDTRYDAAIAAAAELIAARRGQAGPSWTIDECRSLDCGWWIEAPDARSRATALIWTPPSFRRRGMLVAATEPRSSNYTSLSPWTPTAVKALIRLNERLGRIGVIAQVYAYGGDSAVAVTCSAKALTPSLTNDTLTSVFRDARSVKRAASAVAREMKLPAEWLTALTAQYTRVTAPRTEEYVLDLSNLQLCSCSVEHAIALKALTVQTVKDAEGCATMTRKFRLMSAEQVGALVGRYYPDVEIPERTQAALATVFA